ncbi:hypothetical protein [Nannocystis punicea]|uniref:Ig-like domain-containing protein n=1 Tax=Nannocystis punicea TaxID=2995304 RepID=A0ABY7HCV2_9BACT|nr:hypothetical protein [Nannocystis poenicansa]WAS97021.1 hypothetical protein O0S08_12805 [Nannocystis poenicansa]
MRRGVRSVLTCGLALAGCNDHRFGFFPGTESDGTFDPSTDSETIGPTTLSPTLSPTTVSPTTVSPTTVSPTTITTATDTETTIDPTVTVTTSGPTECGEIVLPAVVPIHQVDSLQAKGDDFSLSCGGIGGTDLEVVWTAPVTGRFQFDTIGSTFDSLLAVLEGVCFGGELACDDDSGGNLTSKVEVDLIVGQTVTLVIDSFGQSTADVVYNITQVPVADECPDGVFEPLVPLTIDGQTAGAANIRAGSCNGFESPEIEAMWSAPFDGLFVFEVVEADFDPVLYLLDSTCQGGELACNDDSNGPFPQIAVPMFAGQQVIVVVDGVGGQAGNFVLSIHEG